MGRIHLITRLSWCPVQYIDSFPFASLSLCSFLGFLVSRWHKNEEFVPSRQHTSTKCATSQITPLT